MKLMICIPPFTCIDGSYQRFLFSLSLLYPPIIILLHRVLSKPSIPLTKPAVVGLHQPHVFPSRYKNGFRFNLYKKYPKDYIKNNTIAIFSFIISESKSRHSESEKFCGFPLIWYVVGYFTAKV